MNAPALKLRNGRIQCNLPHNAVGFWQRDPEETKVGSVLAFEILYPTHVTQREQGLGDFPDIYYVTLLDGEPDIQLWSHSKVSKGLGDSGMSIDDISDLEVEELRFLGTKWIPLPKVSGLLPFESV